MSYLLGIEGGGSRSTLLLAKTDGTVIDCCTGDMTNAYGASMKQAQHNLFKMIINILERNNIRIIDIKALGMGSAGMARASEKDLMKQFLKEIGLDCPMALVNDALIALLAGCNKKEGLLLISGTGSIAIGYDPYGHYIRTGGWGYLFGDEGSAFMLGREALMAAVQSYDGRGPKTSLLPLILHYTEVAEVEMLIPKLMTTDHKRKIAAIAPIVDLACQTGDEIAQFIQDKAVEALFKHVKVLLEKLDFKQKTPHLICHGSVLLKNDYIYQNLVSKVHHYDQSVKIAKLEQSAAYGAILLAKELVTP